MNYQIRKNVFFQIILTPISWIYGLLIILRNCFYDWGWFRIHHFPVPLVAIGNIMAGGAGKTPVTMYLLDKLLKKYNMIVIVSRGYGRRSQGVKIVSDGKGKIVTADLGGDEPVMIAKKFTAVPVIVAERRAAGIQLAEEKFNPDLIILDDAYQHRSVYRDVNILLIDINEDPRKQKLIPAGDRREPLKAVSRADLFIYTKCQAQNYKEDPFAMSKWFGGDSFFSRYEPRHFRNVKTNELIASTEMAALPAIAFSGIASPQQFEQSLDKTNIKLYEFIGFPDHHHYGPKDIEMIVMTAKGHNCQTLITTEKDVVKLGTDFFHEFNVFVLEMTVRIRDEEKLIQKIIDDIDMKMKTG